MLSVCDRIHAGLPFVYKGKPYHDCTPEPDARCPTTAAAGELKERNGFVQVDDLKQMVSCTVNFNQKALIENIHDEVR